MIDSKMWLEIVDKIYNVYSSIVTEIEFMMNIRSFPILLACFPRIRSNARRKILISRGQ